MIQMGTILDVADNSGAKKVGCITVLGGSTGRFGNLGDIITASVKEALPETPVFANTGVNIDNVAGIWKIADGCVSGTHFKVDGDTWNQVEADRVRRFMDHVAALR